MLFAVVENHAKSLTTLSKALSQVADSLPRVELSTILYPTERMRDAVVNLYVHLINFLIRARAWYEEGTARHIINAFARPVELRYHDLIQEIESCTREIDILSTAGARAEQRDMHLEIQRIGRSQQETDVILAEIRKLCIETQALHSSGYLNTNRQLTDIQLNNIMESLSASQMIEPLKALSRCQHFQMRVKGKPRPGKSTPLTTISGHRKFKAWQSEQVSAVIMVKGDYKNRESIKALATSMITILRQHQLPVIWTLKPPLQTPGERMSNVDVIRDLVRQAIRLNLSLHSERSLSLSCAMFQAAETPAQWFRLLASVIETLPVLYLVINIEAIDVRLVHTDGGFSWLSSFYSLIKALKERQLKTKLKIFLLSHGSASLQERENLARFAGVVLNAPKTF
ncbi:unnamed protein product [Clonostachys solani]|uniref:DUF7708 domain-containing protein n=1 Tax=Clonostachys solani TaxID=160281 RepID=A0A9P0ELD0_9HYPO|nr:unnamed protein product [Clonostachys solani]